MEQEATAGLASDDQDERRRAALGMLGHVCAALAEIIGPGDPACERLQRAAADLLPHRERGLEPLPSPATASRRSTRLKDRPLMRRVK